MVCILFSFHFLEGEEEKQNIKRKRRKEMSALWFCSLVMATEWLQTKLKEYKAA